MEAKSLRAIGPFLRPVRACLSTLDMLDEETRVRVIIAQPKGRSPKRSW